MSSESLSQLENVMRRNAPKSLAARMLRELLDGRATRAALAILVLSIATLLYLCVTH